MPLYRVCGASRPGSKHEGLDANNQDAFACRAQDGDGALLVVSDGAGSHRHSRAGADITARLTLDFLAGLDWDAPFRPQAETHLAALREAIGREAAERGFEPREMSCTLVAAAVGAKGWRAMQVGDGFLVARFSEGEPYVLVFDMAKGEYANETVFVTHSKSADFLKVHEDGRRPLFLCLSTDGVERQAIRLREGEPHPPFFDYLMKVAADDRAFAHLERFLAMPSMDEATDDDRTLLCARRL